MRKLAIIVRVQKTLRKGRRLSLRRMAKLTGISSSTLSRIENGHKFDIDTFLKMCKYQQRFELHRCIKELLTPSKSL